VSDRRVRLLVHGRVQGVGFRWFVRERARAHGIQGWVRNRPDGTVELAASGSDDAMVAFERVVGQGPPGAQVQRIDQLAAPDEALPSPFTILH
jgi:acylphosphatase